MEISFLIFISILLFFSFISSGFETAFVSLDIDRIFLASSKYARRVFLKKPREILNTILLLNNIVNAAIAIFITGFFAMKDGFISAVVSGTLSSFILIILIGELIPKYIASKFPYYFIKFGHPFIFIFYLLFSPFIDLLTDFYSRFLKGEVRSKRDELLWLLLAKERRGIISPEIGRALKSALYFSEKEVIEVLKPRTELFAINIDDKFENIKEIISRVNFNKIPVYRKDLDNIIGFVFKEDVKKSKDKDELQKKIKKILFFPENSSLETAVKKMKRENIPIAIVVDEYGGTSGFFTLEDVVHELIGEFHEPEREIIIDGKTRVDDLKEVYGITFPEGPFETIAGFLIEMKGDFPEENEIIEYGDYKFQVISRDKKRIKKVKIFR